MSERNTAHFPEAALSKTSLPHGIPPCVTLVGAGCHDASWLTHAAKEALEQADLVIYDDLVDESILQLAKQARKIYRGKRGHRKSADQSEINSLLIDSARNFKNVVRLKGGDPMIFGRGMEEIEALDQAGIQCRIVPGISSFYGIPAKELLGLTKRDEAGGFMVLTAHQAGKARTLKQWQEIAGFEGTIVFLMGMHEAGLISASLIEAGKSPNTPCAVLTSPLFTITASVKTTLAQLSQAIESNHLKSPGIIVIGGSANSYKPLQPFQVALTSSALLNRKIEAGMPVEFQFAPLFHTEYEDFPVQLKSLLAQKPDWLVFTSAHGALIFLKDLRQEQLDIRELAGCRIACIGAGTAKAFEEWGIFPDLVPEKPDGSEQLARKLLEQCSPQDKVILFQSKQALPILFQELQDHVHVQFVPLYTFRTIPAKAAKTDINFDCLVLASRTAAKAYAGLNPRPQTKTVIAFSKAITSIVQETFSKEAKESRPDVFICKHPSAQEVQELLLDLAREKTAGNKKQQEQVSA